MREIDIDLVTEVVAQDAPLIDVREPAEFREGHIPGAVNIPAGRLPDLAHQIPRDRPVYLVCATGNRSSAMSDFLSAEGFDAVNVLGGTKAWIRSGRAIEQ